MSKHTPGPWAIGTSADHTPAVTVPTRREGTGFCVAQLNRIPRMGSGNMDANARLIAAAPTMYDYLAKRAAAGDSEAAQILGGINGSR